MLTAKVLEGLHPTVPDSVHDGVRPMAKLDASVSSPGEPGSGVAAAEVVSPEAPSHQKEMRLGKSSELKNLEGRTSLQEKATNIPIPMIRKNVHFADDVPQHFKQPDRSLHPTVACVTNARWTTTIYAIY